MCKKKITLNKHTNTNHGGNIEEKLGFSKCSLCEEKFDTEKELQKHKEDHIEEIEGTNIAEITNGHDLFECNLCSFESGHEDSIREHMIVHVNCTKQNQIDKSKETEIPRYKSLLDEYDDSGNYIGDDPKMMESDYQESESDDDSDE
jgi:hypothetical protein